MSSKMIIILVIALAAIFSLPYIVGHLDCSHWFNNGCDWLE